MKESEEVWRPLVRERGEPASTMKVKEWASRKTFVRGRNGASARIRSLSGSASPELEGSVQQAGKKSWRKGKNHSGGTGAPELSRVKD